MNTEMPVKSAALASAAVAPAIGALPYLVYFVGTVASRFDSSGVPAIFKAIAASAFYIPFILIGAYVSAFVPAALVGAGYAYLLNRWPRIRRNRWLRVLSAATIAFAVCAFWALTFGQLAVVEFVGKMAWTIIGCGVFAAVVLAIIFPKERRSNAAA